MKNILLIGALAVGAYFLFGKKAEDPVQYVGGEGTSGGASDAIPRQNVYNISLPAPSDPSSPDFSAFLKSDTPTTGKKQTVPSGFSQSSDSGDFKLISSPSVFYSQPENQAQIKKQITSAQESAFSFGGFSGSTVPAGVKKQTQDKFQSVGIIVPSSGSGESKKSGVQLASIDDINKQTKIQRF